MAVTLVFGRSGSGKDFITKSFGLKKVQSYTTRKMRPEEITRDIKDLSHIFIDTFDSIKKKAKDFWVARKEHYEAEYGALFSQIQDSDIYVIDPMGVEMFFVNLINHGKADYAKEVNVINFRCVFYKRIYRMIKRDLSALEKFSIREFFKIIKNVFKRFKTDFSLFKNEKDIAREFCATVIRS